MKKHLLLLACMAVSLMSMAKPFTMAGTIHYSDGRNQNYASIAVPGPEDKFIVVYEDSKKTKVNTSDILSIDFWDELSPSKVSNLSPINIQDARDVVRIYCLREQANSWGAVYLRAEYFSLESNGELMGHVDSENGVTSLNRHYFIKTNEEKATLLYTNQSWTSKSAAARLFADVPSVADGILNGSLKPSDMAYILDAMETGATTLEKESEKMEAYASEKNDADANYDSPTSGTTTKPSKNNSTKHSRTRSTIGLDLTYDMNTGFRVEYAYYFSKNQSVMAHFEYDLWFFMFGFQIGCPIYEVQEPVGTGYYVYGTMPTLGLGLDFGFRFPIQMGRVYLIPKAWVEPAFTPILPFKRKYDVDQILDMPVCVGLDFSLPVGSLFAVNIGLHYAYDLSFCGSYGSSGFMTDPLTPRKYLNDNKSIMGQHGLGVSVALFW